jgi:hypothetical protein
MTECDSKSSKRSQLNSLKKAFRIYDEVNGINDRMSQKKQLISAAALGGLAAAIFCSKTEAARTS